MNFKFKNKIPTVRFDGFNEEKRKQKNKKEIVLSKRLLCLLGLLTVLSLILIVRLAFIQLSQGEVFEVKLEKYGTTTYSQDANRGEISDRNYTKLVKNTNVINAVYYAPKKITKEEIAFNVNFLLDNVNIDISGVTEREKKDYFILACEDIVDALITDEEREQWKKDDNYEKKLYNAKIERITIDMINKHMDETLIKKTRLQSMMEQCTSGSVVLLEGLSVEDASVIGGNSGALKGIQVDSDWQREKVFNEQFSGVLGKLTTKKQGLPAELKNELLALGYQNDSRVGASGLEAEYENLLRGIDSTYTLGYDSNGDPIINGLKTGTNGTNLRLAIDWELQQYADELITQELISRNGNPKYKYFDRMFFILMDPNNGDILVMSGKTINKETGVVSDYADGNYKSAYLIGSTTKGGTLYTAYKQGILTPGEVMMDEPIKIKGTAVKKSWSNLGAIDDITALARSSNVYMFRLAMRMGNATYGYNQPLVLDKGLFDMYRQCLGELGLGVKTGIDIPDESLGYRGPYAKRESGLFLDFVIGQYDSFTPIQLAQYASTLANRGKRIQPRLVIEGYTEDSEGNKTVTFENKTAILDDVSNQTLAFDRIHQGFRSCVTMSNGLCRATWAGKPYTVSAKTGSAQVFDSTNTDYANLLEIGWATEENPQVVYASVCPRQYDSTTAGKTAALILDRYNQKYGFK